MSKMGIDMRGMLVSQLPRPRRTKPIKEFFKWCARDGGYAHRRVIPNIILESVMPGDPIHYGTERLKKRLARLAQRWRDHLALEPADPENGFEAVYSREPPVVWGILAFEQKIIFCMVNSAHDPDFPPSASPSPSPPPVQYTKTGKVKVVPKKERESLEAEREEREERGRTTIENWGKLQVMTTVDWRDSTMDVWNAFTVAILCVKARDYMMEWRGDWPLKEGRTSSDPNVDESDN